MKEEQLRKYIRKILNEQNEEEPQTTQRRGRGRYKKSIEAAKLVPPAELMSRLKAKRQATGTPIEKLENFLDSASGGVDAMSIVYGSPSVKTDSAGRQGAMIPLNSIKGGGGTIPPRDGRRYIEHTMNAGVKSGFVDIPANGYQVEIFGNAVLVYLSESPYTWNRGSAGANESDSEEENLLGEPDLSQEDERDEEKDEYSVSANVAGVVTPMGTGPSGGKRSNKKDSPRKRAIDANERAFGGGKVYSPKKK